MELDTRTAATPAASLAVIATDGELLMRFRRHRDEAAFAEVVERHGRLVWLVCKQALRHHQDVEDAFQATFLILAQRASTIRASDSAAAWLYRVAQRTAIAARRKRDRRREEPLAAEPPQGEEALPVIHDRQMIYVLMEELRALPERYQTPLVLRYFEGQSRRSIAEQTDSTLAQIQGRLVRGKRMLRSRLIRRGVSLSLAVGVVATASTAASAAVSPSLVAATAANSSSFIASGAAGGASPAAVELAKQGVHAMWYASIAKFATVAATVLVAAGIVWAAQQGDGVADIAAGRGATDGVDLQAVAVEVDDAEEPAVVTIAAAEPAKNGAEANEAEEAVEEAPPQIRQLELERDHWLLKAQAYRMKARIIRKLIKQQETGSIRETDAMLLEAEAKLAEAKAIEMEVQLKEHAKKQGQAEIPEAQSDPADAAEVLKPGDQIEVIILPNNPSSPTPFPRLMYPLTLDSAGRIPLEPLQSDARPVEVAGVDPRRAEVIIAQSLRIDRDIVRVRWIEPAAASRAAGEPPPLPAASPASDPGVLSPGDTIVIRTVGRSEDGVYYSIDLIDGDYPVESMGTVALGPVYGRVKVAGLSILEAEQAIGKHLGEQEQSEVVVQVTLGTEAKSADVPPQPAHASTGPPPLPMVPPSPVPVDPPSMPGAQLLASIPPAATPSLTDPVLNPGDTIRISAAVNVSEQMGTSFENDFSIEPMGTVALGREYGRVKVAGLTILEAEEAIKNHLAENFENPMVQVTMVERAVQGSSFSFGNVPRTAAAGDLESGGELRALIEALRAENAALNKRIEELRKEQRAKDWYGRPAVK